MIDCCDAILYVAQGISRGLKDSSNAVESNSRDLRMLPFYADRAVSVLRQFRQQHSKSMPAVHNTFKPLVGKTQISA